MAKRIVAERRPGQFGRPRGFRVPVREVRLSGGGGGSCMALCGTMMTMPGLPTKPAGENVDMRRGWQDYGAVLIGITKDMKDPGQRSRTRRELQERRMNGWNTHCL